MARGNFNQTSFLGGEWSPFSQGKTDLREYYTALNLSLNFIPTDEGALVRRSGTRLSAHAKDSSGDIRLIPFISETGDALVCEFTDGLVRFHSNGTILSEEPKELTGITAADPAVVTTLEAHGYSDDDTVVFISPDQPYPLPVRNKQYIISSASGSTFNLNNTGPMGSGTTDGTELNGILDEAILTVARVVERDVDYAAADLPSLKYTEEEDRLYLFHPDHTITTIDRTNLVVDQPDFIDGPYLDLNETATTLGFSGTSGSITATASGVTGINDGSGFLTTDVGRLIRVNSGTDESPDWTYLKITARASTTSVTATVMGPDLAATTAVTTWRLGAFCDTTGYPSHGVIHEQRLFVVCPAFPGRLFASRTGKFFDYTPTDQDGTVADDNGVTAIFAGAGRQNSKWLQSVSDGLLVGTDGGEYLARASSLDDPITPFSIQVRRKTEFGSADALPARAGSASVFIQELGRSVYKYKVEGSNYDGTDISRSGRHLTTDGIIEIAYQKIPNPVIWGRRGDGRLVGCTFRDDAEGEQVAWHRHSIEYAADVANGEDVDGRYLRGGRSGSAGTLHSIAVAPFSDVEVTRNDTLWLAVDREGTTCVEYLTPIFDISFRQNEGFFVDSGNLYYQGDEGITWETISDNGTDATVRFYGLDRLNGKDVDGMFRGLDIGSDTVSDGYADFTFASELLDVEAAIEGGTYDGVTDPAFTASPIHISDVHQSNPNTLGNPHPQMCIITGEDGNRYFLGGGNTGGSGGGNEVIIYDADTGSSALTLTNAQAKSDADGASIIPPSGGLGTGNATFAAVPIPDTPFIVVIYGSVSGTSNEKRILYYKINSGGSLQLMGGYAGKVDGNDVQFSPKNGPGEAIYAAGHIMAARTTGSLSGIAYEYPIAIAYHGESRSTVMVLPSINYAIANTPLTENVTDFWGSREINIGTIGYGASIFNLSDSPYGTNNRSRGFFLPRKYGLGAHFAQMFYLSDLEAFDAGTETTSNSYLDTHASAYVTGLISSTQINAKYDPLGNKFGHAAYAYGTKVDRHTDFDIFPFPDEKEDYDGNAGNAVDNYYGNPTVLPYDPDDPTKPWFLFFPRFYRENSDRDKMGIRIYSWNPITEKARFLSFQKAQIYTLGVDVDSDVNPISSSVTWDRDTGELTLLTRSFSSGEADMIVTEFGTFVPVLGPVDFVDPQHVDAIIGCGYSSRAQLLRPDAGAGAQNGGGLGKLRRADNYALLTFNTGPVEIGTSFDETFPVNFENIAGADAYGRDPLFSQVAQGSLQSSYDFDNLMLWAVDRPVPGAFISVAGFSNMSDR